VIASVLRGSAINSARTRSPVPDWDLFLVLEFLRSQDFEPLHLASLSNLTRKTLFLILLATARRGSEIHSLSGLPKDISFESDRCIVLKFRPAFLAKNQKPDQPAPVIRIPTLSSILSTDDPDIVNCPTRALSSYLNRTALVRSPGQKLLFISLNSARDKDISKVTLAKWVSTLIKQAYSWWDSNGDHALTVLPLHSARAHETRAWSTSLAVTKSGRLSEVLQAAYWSSEDVFINFYLRDIASARQDGTYRLPAMVTAGQVLSTS